MFERSLQMISQLHDRTQFENNFKKCKFMKFLSHNHVVLFRHVYHREQNYSILILEDINSVKAVIVNIFYDDKLMEIEDLFVISSPNTTMVNPLVIQDGEVVESENFQWGRFILKLLHTIAFFLKIETVRLIDESSLKIIAEDGSPIRIPLRILRHLQGRKPFYESLGYTINHPNFNRRNYKTNKEMAISYVHDELNEIDITKDMNFYDINELKESYQISWNELKNILVIANNILVGDFLDDGVLLNVMKNISENDKYFSIDDFQFFTY